MSSSSPLDVYQLLLRVFSSKIFPYFKNPIPSDSSLLMVSNHSRFLDAPILISMLESPICFSCHHYMVQVPLLRKTIIEQLGHLLLEANHQSNSGFSKNSEILLQVKEAVEIFLRRDSTNGHIYLAQPSWKFQRGFAHLVGIAWVENFAILPVSLT